MLVLVLVEYELVSSYFGPQVVVSSSRDVVEDSMVEAKAKAKAKATKFCPRGVHEVEASPRGPHPCIVGYFYTE